MKKENIKKYVILELFILGILTSAFLFIFSKRSIYLDVGLALCALFMLALNRKFSKEVIWSPFSFQQNLQQCYGKVGVVTFALVLVFFVLASKDKVWSSGNIFIAIVVYFPWALLQQTLFQFYLLGRLCTLFPFAIAITITGICYALVHLPDLTVVGVTTVSGIFWTYMYYHYRLLSPLALSHAILGSSFYYWIYGQDLVKNWGIL